MLNYKEVKIVNLQDWDYLVSSTYGRTYSFQQQDDCKSRGTHYIKIPDKSYDYKNDTLPEVVNCNEMGVKFKSWLERNPNKPLVNQKYDFELDLWWERNFYPDVQVIANDLYQKGLIKSGEYIIEIDW